MRLHTERSRPEPWRERRAKVRHAWTVPFVRLEYGLEWVAYALSIWKFLEVLEYLSSLGVLIAVIFYFAEAGDRMKQKHYQAWQVINSAQGKGGNGGRIEALEELNTDKVSLIGVDLSSAFLRGVRLKKASLARANFNAADAREATMEGANIPYANLRSANFRGATLKNASLQGSTLDGADFTGVELAGADLTGASLEDADFRNADLEGMKWGQLASVKGLNVYGVKDAPAGFVDWVMAHGGVRKEEE
jgi:Pentapeptide repeats (8 copies)